MKLCRSFPNINKLLSNWTLCIWICVGRCTVRTVILSWTGLFKSRRIQMYKLSWVARALLQYTIPNFSKFVLSSTIDLISIVKWGQGQNTVALSALFDDCITHFLAHSKSKLATHWFNKRIGQHVYWKSSCRWFDSAPGHHLTSEVSVIPTVFTELGLE